MRVEADHQWKFEAGQMQAIHGQRKCFSPVTRNATPSSLGRILHLGNSRFYEAQSLLTMAVADSDVSEAVALAEGVKAVETWPEGKLEYVAPSGTDAFWTSFKLAFALPWRRFKNESVLVIKMEGDISDQARGRFDPGLSIPQICQSLQKAALDPRIKGLAIEIGPLAVGWAKAQEIRRYLTYFRQSGKFSVVYMKQGGEKEMYLASACEEIYMPPSASLSLRGFAVTGTFLRGVLDRVGVDPQVKRIGKYKSAGDQLLRKDMSEPQAEQLSAILEDIYDDFLTTVSAARGKTKEELSALLDEGVYDMERFLEGGWVTGLKYEDEVLADLKKRVGCKEEEPLRTVAIRRYSKVSPTAFGLTGKKRIAVLRTSGAIVGGSGAASSGSITPGALIPQLRALARDKKVAAVVLRVDSPGGDALASDLMWREIRQLGEKKPVVASMGDVAASGGYYMGMACKTIVAEPLTITGSIGVVTGKFNLAELYGKIGYSKTLISKGRYAELLADNRPFTEDEAKLFDAAAEHAYRSFRDKAASSRGMQIEAMQEIAQGRVWTGVAALERGLVDALGGVNRAVAIAKKLADIPDDERVTVLELSRKQASPLALLGGGASLKSALEGISALLLGQGPSSSLSSLLPLISELQQSGRPGFIMTELDALQLSSSGPVTPSSGRSTFLDEDEGDDSIMEKLFISLQNMM